MYLAWVIAIGVVFAVFGVMIRHLYFQHALDASTDAGATRVQMVVSNESSGEVLESRLIIDEIEALNAATATFNKNMNNMEDMEIDTSLVLPPSFSFPDDQSISGTMDFEHDLSGAADGLNAIFDSNFSPGRIDDNVESTSRIGEKK
jgi:hypothetical protein